MGQNTSVPDIIKVTINNNQITHVQNLKGETIPCTQQQQQNILNYIQFNKFVPDQNNQFTIHRLAIE